MCLLRCYAAPVIHEIRFSTWKMAQNKFPSSSIAAKGYLDILYVCILRFIYFIYVYIVYIFTLRAKYSETIFVYMIMYCLYNIFNFGHIIIYNFKLHIADAVHYR